MTEVEMLEKAVENYSYAQERLSEAYRDRHGFAGVYSYGSGISNLRIAEEWVRMSNIRPAGYDSYLTTPSYDGDSLIKCIKSINTNIAVLLKTLHE